MIYNDQANNEIKIITSLTKGFKQIIKKISKQVQFKN